MHIKPKSKSLESIDAVLHRRFPEHAKLAVAVAEENIHKLIWKMELMPRRKGGKIEDASFPLPLSQPKLPLHNLVFGELGANKQEGKVVCGRHGASRVDGRHLTVYYNAQHVPIVRLPTDAAILRRFQGVVKVVRNPRYP